MWKKPESEMPAQSPSSPSTARDKSHSFEARTQPGKPSVIGPSICIAGDISGDEDLLIEGKIEGKIVLNNHNVTVGKNGRIKADIHGKTVTIDGNVEGNLFGGEQFVIRQNGVVRGNIVAPRVVLEDGCNFKGNIDMSSKETPARPSISIPSASSEDDSDTDII